MLKELRDIGNTVLVVEHDEDIIRSADHIIDIGPRISGGCTSGHGISGIGRFSVRSIVATITFMIVGIITVYLKNNL